MNIIVNKLLSWKYHLDSKEIILKIWENLSLRQRYPQSYYYNEQDFINNIFAFEEFILESIDTVFTLNKDDNKNKGSVLSTS